MASIHSSRLRKWILSSPPAERVWNRIRELLIGALRQGPIPRHVAFVMDGNRRFAREHHIETLEGHNLGFEALARILEVCYKSGVKVVTIYAFSIENFKRTKYEVDALMEMAKVKLSQISQHGDLLERYGAKIRILGQRKLLRPDVLEAIDKAVEMTSGNGQAVLNVCFPYTSRDEITSSIRSTVSSYSTPTRPALKRPFSESHIARNLRAQQLSTVAEEPALMPPPVPNQASGTSSSGSSDSQRPSRSPSPPSTSSTTLPPPSLSGLTAAETEAQDPTTPRPQLSRSPLPLPDPETITTETLTSHMFTADCPPLDLLIRTSGVERLSDFMLWQCHEDTQIVFLKCMWPEFDLWHFLPVLIEWQWWNRKADQEGRGRRGRRDDRTS